MSNARNNEVIAHYKTVNPSLRVPPDWPLLAARQRALYEARLNLPVRLFEGANVLDVACGTGEFRVFTDLSTAPGG